MNSNHEYYQTFATTNLDLYYDDETQWPRVYGFNLDLNTCKEKESVLQVTLFNFIPVLSQLQFLQIPVVYNGDPTIS